MPNPTHQEFVQGLRELADFYEAHPEVKLPSYSSSFTVYATSWLFSSKEEAKEVVITAAKAFGHAEKVYSQEGFELKKEFSGQITLTVQTERSTVCRAVVVGKKRIPSQVIPAEPERYIPEREEDQVEWKCESLLAPTQEQSFSSMMVDGEPPVSSWVETVEEEGLKGEQIG